MLKYISKNNVRGFDWVTQIQSRNPLNICRQLKLRWIKSRKQWRRWSLLPSKPWQTVKWGHWSYVAGLDFSSYTYLHSGFRSYWLTFMRWKVPTRRWLLKQQCLEEIWEIQVTLSYLTPTSPKKSPWAKFEQELYLQFCGDAQWHWGLF